MASGAEYTNAQAADLKDLIDNFADQIEGMTPGFCLGLIWLNTWSTEHGELVVWMTGEEVDEIIGTEVVKRNKITFRAAGGFNNDGGLTAFVSTGIPKKIRPTENINLIARPSWSDVHHDEMVTVTLTPRGSVAVMVDAGTIGMFSASEDYYAT